MVRPDAGPVTVVSWQAEVNAVLPSPQAIEAYERIDGVVGIGATAALIGGAFRARKGS